MRGTKKVGHRRFRPLSPLLSLIRFDPFPGLAPCMPCTKRRSKKRGRAEEKGASSHSLRSFGLHFFCPPLHTLLLFFLCWALSVSLFFLLFLILVLSLLPFPSWIPPFRQTRKTTKGERTSGGHKVTEEKNTSCLSSSTSSSWFITNETVR